MTGAARRRSFAPLWSTNLWSTGDPGAHKERRPEEAAGSKDSDAALAGEGPSRSEEPSRAKNSQRRGQRSPSGATQQPNTASEAPKMGEFWVPDPRVHATAA